MGKCFLCLSTPSPISLCCQRDAVVTLGIIGSMLPFFSYLCYCFLLSDKLPEEWQGWVGKYQLCPKQQESPFPTYLSRHVWLWSRVRPLPISIVTPNCCPSQLLLPDKHGNKDPPQHHAVGCDEWLHHAPPWLHDVLVGPVLSQNRGDTGIVLICPNLTTTWLMSETHYRFKVQPQASRRNHRQSWSSIRSWNRQQMSFVSYRGSP